MQGMQTLSALWEINTACKINPQGIAASVSMNTLYAETAVELKTGGAWLSSARVVRCWVKSRNERNPYH